MTSESTGKLGVGAVIGSRFRVDATLDSSGNEAFLGVEQATGTPVVLMVIPAEQSKALEKAKPVEHAHLGRVLDVVALDDGRHVGIAARIDGGTLEERVRTSSKHEPVDAVRTALRVADALHALHAAGATHGFVHARSVVLSPEGREPPVLAFAPPTGTDAWHAPEHQANAPTQADDAWAAAALLHLMLTGKRPPPDGYVSEGELDAAGVLDATLRAVLRHALAKTQEGRGDLHDLRRDLARWFVDHAGEEPIPPGPHQAPPPLPPSLRSVRPPGASSRPPPPPPRKRHFVRIAFGAVAIGLIAGGAVAFLRPKHVKVAAAPAPKPPPTASAIELGEVPVTGQGEQLLGSKLATCIAGYLPKGSFSKAPDVEWLCTETDPRVGAEKLHGAIVLGAPKGPPSEAMKIFARIGWYDMAAFAVVRAGCCAEAKGIALPDAHPDCSMDAALREVGEAVIAVRDVDAALKKYTESIHCELNRGGAKVLRRSERPGGGEDTAFLDLVKRLE